MQCCHWADWYHGYRCHFSSQRFCVNVGYIDSSKMGHDQPNSLACHIFWPPGDRDSHTWTLKNSSTDAQFRARTFGLPIVAYDMNAWRTRNPDVATQLIFGGSPGFPVDLFGIDH